MADRLSGHRDFRDRDGVEARLDAVESLRLVFGVLRGTQDQILDMLPGDNYGLLPR